MRIDITSPEDPRIALYRGVSDPDLLTREGRFVAEGRLVVRRLLRSSRFEAESVLVTPAALADMADVLEAAAGHLPVYVAPRELLIHVAGFNIHRGCLALGRRPAPAEAASVLPPDDEPALVVVLEALANADNVGGIFRNAQAFGASAVLLDETTCDPLYRKAIRTSMGASLAVPFARVGEWPGGLEMLRQRGFTIVALTPRGEADIWDVVGARTEDRVTPGRVAVLVGNEGSGLSEAADAMADLRVGIPMAPGADSLNAATAAGIALHAFARYCGLA